MNEKLKVYKGTDEKIKCRGYQFVVGQEHIEEKADLCSSGFHACEYPLDVFGYYPPGTSRYFEAELGGVDRKKGDTTKRVGKSIKLAAEIGIPGLVKASVEYIKSKVDWENAKEFNTGNQSAATNTGYRSAATNTGDQSAASVEGKDSVAIVTGRYGKACGKIGCVLFLIERNDDGEITAHKSIKVDGKRYKEMVYYTLEDGKVVKADD